MTSGKANRRTRTPLYDHDPLVEGRIRSEDLAEYPSIVEDLRGEIIAARRTHRALSIALLKFSLERSSSTGEATRGQVRKFLQLFGGNLRHTDKCGLVTTAEALVILPGAEADGARIAMNRSMAFNFAKRLRGLGLIAEFGIAELASNNGSTLELFDAARTAIHNTEPAVA